MKKLGLLFVFLFALQSGWGQLLNNGGFEANTASPGTGWGINNNSGSFSYSLNSGSPRTGTNNIQTANFTNYSSGIQYVDYIQNTASLTVSSGNYLHIICWAYISSTTGSGRLWFSANHYNVDDHSAATVLTTSYAQYSDDIQETGSSATGLSQTTNNLVQIGFANGSATARTFYLDDVVAYQDANSTSDLTAPGAATGFTNGTITSSSAAFTWTNGTDATAPVTNVQGYVVLRAPGATAGSPTLNNQGIYSVAGGTSGPNTDVSGNWTVISYGSAASNGSAGSYTDNTVSASTSYKYAIINYDLAYNYSSALVSGTITTPAVASPSVAINNNVSQPAAANVPVGTSNLVVGQYSLSVTSATTALTGMTYTATGTGYNATDLTDIKVWYSTTNTFAVGTSTLLSTVTSFTTSGAKQTCPSFTSQNLPLGSGYIYITADIANCATATHAVNINALTPSNLTTSSGTVTGSTAAGGIQTITGPTVAFAINGSAIAANNKLEGTTNVVLQQSAITVSGGGVATVTGLNFSTIGSYVAADISNFKLWYSSTTSFTVGTPLSTVSAPTASTSTQAFTSFTQTINSGSTGYFYVTADISTAAIGGHTIGAAAVTSPDGFVFCTTPSSSSGNLAVQGLQTITTPSVSISNDGTQIAAANVYAGTNTVVLNQVQLTVSTATTTLTGLTFTATGSYVTGDISNFQLWYATTPTFSTATVTNLGSISPSASGVVETFSSLTQTLTANNSNYLFITANFATCATVSPTHSLSTNAMGTGNLTINTGTVNASTATGGGIQTIIGPTITIGNISGTAVPAAGVSQSQTNVILQSASVTVTGQNATLTGMTFTTAGSYATTDITDIKLWYYTGSTFNAGSATLLSTINSPATAGTLTFPSFTSQTINSGSTGYLYITADITAGAVSPHTINSQPLSASNFTFCTNAVPTVSCAAGGAQTITTPSITVGNNGTQPTNTIGAAQTNVVLLQATLTVSVASANLTGMTFTATGNAYNTSDLLDVNVWYSTSNTFAVGTSTLLSTITSFTTSGNTQTCPSFTTQTIPIGTAYIYITADAGTCPTASHSLAVSALSNTNLTFSSVGKSGTTSAGGTQTISAPSVALAINGTVSAGNQQVGATNVVLQQSQLTVTTASTSLSGMTFTTSGTYVAADILDFKLWYYTGSTFSSSTATLVSTLSSIAASGSAQTFSFSANQAFPVGTDYLYITADISSSATNGHTVGTASLAAAGLSFCPVKAATGTVAAQGLQTIIVPTITTGTVNTSSFTLSSCTATASGTVAFTTTGSYNSGNSFTAQLSSSTGSFASPVTIGTFTGTSSGNTPSGTIQITIPAGTATGSGYLVRVISSNLAETGSTSTTTLTITQSCGQNTSNITFPEIGCNAFQVTWTSGTGIGRILVVYSGAITVPTNGTNYSESQILKSGATIGTGTVVYDGAGTGVITVGAKSGTTYTVVGFEYASGYVYQTSLTHSVTVTTDATCVCTVMTGAVINGCNSNDETSKCTEGCGEGDTEILFFQSSSYGFALQNGNGAQGTNSGSVPYINYYDINSGSENYIDDVISYLSEPSIISSMNSQSGCSGIFIDAYTTGVPPWSTYIIVPSTFCPSDYVFTNFCSTYSAIYVLFHDLSTGTISGGGPTRNCDEGNYGNGQSSLRYFELDMTQLSTLEGGASSSACDYFYSYNWSSSNDGDGIAWTGSAIGGNAYNSALAGTEVDASSSPAPCGLSLVLPIELLNFTAESSQSFITINWATATEVNSDFFGVEYSFDGENFTPYAQIKGAGNSNSVKKYYCPFIMDIGNASPYFRLKMVDKNGKYKYSPVITLDNNANGILQSLRTYYNSDNVSIVNKFNLPLAAEASFTLYNLEGQNVYTSTNIFNVGFNQFLIPCNDLNTGVYILVYQNGNAAPIHKKVLVTK